MTTTGRNPTGILPKILPNMSIRRYGQDSWSQTVWKFVSSRVLIGSETTRDNRSESKFKQIRFANTIMISLERFACLLVEMNQPQNMPITIEALGKISPKGFRLLRHTSLDESRQRWLGIPIMNIPLGSSAHCKPLLTA